MRIKGTLKRRVSFVIPLPFSTAYRANASAHFENGHIVEDDPGEPMFTRWWMWAGHVFRHRVTAI